jgi:hypothetical protein
MVLVAACSSSDDDDEDDDGGDNTPAATESTDGDETPDASDEEDAASLLESLTGESGEVVAKVAYDFTTTTNGTASTSSMTIYSRPGESRTDIVDTDSGETTSFISTADATYLCTGEQCIGYPAGGGVNPVPFVSQYANPSAITQLVASYRGVDIDQSEEEIAGLDATCFSVAQGGTTVSWCYGDEGLLLRSATESATGSFVMEATEVDLEISDEDFEPPYPVTTIPNLGQ